MRNLAERLLAAEAADEGATAAHVPAAVRVCEKLRLSLTRFAGADGFASLLRRALALACAECPTVQTVKLQRDGSLTGLDALPQDATDGGREAAVAITVQLLGLLVTFIGEPLTMRLVGEAWPDVALDDWNRGIEAL